MLGADGARLILRTIFGGTFTPEFARALRNEGRLPNRNQACTKLSDLLDLKYLKLPDWQRTTVTSYPSTVDGLLRFGCSGRCLGEEQSSADGRDVLALSAQAPLGNAVAANVPRTFMLPPHRQAPLQRTLRRGPATLQTRVARWTR